VSWFDKVKSLFSSDSELIQEQNNVEQAFLNVCANAGLGAKILDNTNAIELFKEWYEGDGSEEDVLKSIPGFMESHPVVNAKFIRFFKR
tara:strand:+ start:171 stop:437 length:267 start_codon:yes stop_codon:yes gene_type:complete